MEIKVGDVVVLNSGSPQMTVKYISEGKVDTVWYNEKESKFDTALIPVELLSKVD